MAKIAIIINSLYTIGGEERVVSLMANEFVKYHEVTIISSETRRKENGKRNNYYLDKRINVVVVEPKNDSIFDKVVKLIYWHIGVPNCGFCRKILNRIYYPNEYLNIWTDRINSGNFDIVIPITGNNTMLVGLIKERITARCISWEHSSYEGYFAKKTGAFKCREKTFSECANKLEGVVVLNEDIQSKYKSQLNVKSIVIENPKSFSSNEKCDLCNKVIVSCGRLESEKAFDDLIYAFELFHRKNTEWKLKIIGGGRLEGQLISQIKKLGLSEVVSITGYTDNVKEELLKGSIFCMTSRWEGFPMTITEALEVGLPVVGYGIPALKPLISDGIEGIIVSPYERNKLVEALEEIANSDKIRMSMSLAAIEKAKLLKPEAIYEKWDVLFKKVMSE